MTIRDQLLVDHRRLEALFENLLEAFAADAREDTQSLWSELDRNLEAHFDFEERVLFPEFERTYRSEAEALRAEHRQLRTALAELGVGVDLKAVRSEVARAFIDSLRAHALREDKLLYRWADLAMPFVRHSHAEQSHP